MYIGDEGGKQLAQFLKITPTVKSLELKGNNLSP
jgi:hypothetical protein